MPTLDEQLADFRRRIDKLEDQAKKASGALQLAPHQVGPRPGWFRAARIEGSQMILDFSSSQTGVSPRISVTDTAGRTRVEMGNLADYLDPNGIDSPAQYGFRAIAANGTTMFDSDGLVAVEQYVANLATNAVTVTSTTPVTVPGSTTTFTLNRQGFIRVSSLVTASLTGAAGNFAYISLLLSGPTGLSGSEAFFDRNVPGYTNAATPIEFFGQPLSAGVYTLAFVARVDDAALTLNIGQATATVYLQGVQ